MKYATNGANGMNGMNGMNGATLFPVRAPRAEFTFSPAVVTFSSGCEREGVARIGQAGWLDFVALDEDPRSHTSYPEHRIRAVRWLPEPEDFSGEDRFAE